jgi:hypothetical protein
MSRVYEALERVRQTTQQVDAAGSVEGVEPATMIALPPGNDTVTQGTESYADVLAESEPDAAATVRRQSFGRFDDRTFAELIRDIARDEQELG